MEKARVQKFIALSGYCSRRKAEELIERGVVKVNGVISKLGDQCLPTDSIYVEGKKINFNVSDKVYIVMNKARGYVCSNEDKYNEKTVFDLLDKKDNKAGIFSVGRLDKDTTGLLILTNDGDFAQKVIHPSSKIKKEYIANLDRKLEDRDRISIEKGLVLDDIKLSTCKIKEIGEKLYLVSIWEGRKRQVRRMFEMKNYKVFSLRRVRIGNLDLKSFNLKIGEYKVVKLKDLDKIFN